jgi:uncharacterized protein (TIGR03083 family)
MNPPLDYVDHLGRESARFADVLRDTPSTARVPTCPDWDADDLLWHLGKVQWFWGEIARRGVTDAAVANELDPGERPEARAALASFFEAASANLSHALADTDPRTPLWTWSTEQTAGFIRRRQAGEAMVHRLDAELTAGERTPMDPALSADGIDEALRVMYGGCPPWGTITPEAGRTMRLRTTDTGDSWLVSLARFTGTDADGTAYDEPDIFIAPTDPGDNAAASVTGTAEALNCWLWRRPTATELARGGDTSLIDSFEEIIAGGVQ